MADDQSEERQIEQPAFRQVVPQFYVNAITINGGAFDVAMDVGTQTAGEPLNVAARLYLTWEQAKLLLRLLDNAMNEYEDKVGKIRDLQEMRKEEEVTANDDRD
jgi:hypothetical protein